MFYVYVIQSDRDGKFYTGYSADLRKRVEEHNSGKVEATQFRVPLRLVYYEACRNQKDALHRERYLKTTYGHRYIRQRLKHDLGH